MRILSSSKHFHYLVSYPLHRMVVVVVAAVVVGVDVVVC